MKKQPARPKKIELTPKERAQMQILKNSSVLICFELGLLEPKDRRLVEKWKLTDEF